MAEQPRLTREQQEQIRRDLRAGRKPSVKSAPKDWGKPGRRQPKPVQPVDAPLKRPPAGLLGTGMAEKTAARLRKMRKRTEQY